MPSYSVSASLIYYFASRRHIYMCCATAYVYICASLYFMNTALLHICVAAPLLRRFVVLQLVAWARVRAKYMDTCPMYCVYVL